MEGEYGRGIPGVVPGGNSVHREEISVQKNKFWAHFGHSRRKPSGSSHRRSMGTYLRFGGVKGVRLFEFQQELPTWHDPDTVDQEAFLAPVDQHSLRLRVILPESLQSTKIR